MSAQPPGVPEDAASSRLEAEDTFDDMHDSQEQLERFSATLPLALCGPITHAFEEADRAALRFQGKHERLLKITALAGTLAVVLAIIGLAAHAEDQVWPYFHRAFLVMETCAAVGAGLAAYIGIKSEYKEKWLLKRHEAELFRLLRYRFLIRPGIWKRNSEENAKQWIDEEIAAIKTVGGHGLGKAAIQPSPHGFWKATQERLSKEEASDLVQYYLEKRLGPQKEYFANRAQRNEFKDRVRILLPKLFMVSVAVVVIKLFFELPSQLLSAFPRLQTKSFTVLGELTEFAAVWFFAMAAALLPVIAGGVRLRLSAGEFSRNKSRFQAAHRALSRAEESLLNTTLATIRGGHAAGESEDGSILVRKEEFLTGTGFARVRVRTEQVDPVPAAVGDTDVSAILGDLAWCEHVLDAEHREWLRLMHDTEWFG